ncbi:hypothetical protein HZH68_001840 [Vespula germanica]|uniref:Uncharacterized protein n=1 Tax=Vespula germanica TaxID=30212 RepID=A0A834KWS3_VESGE|nr:hypothetical protein HZH68_001840 [Vespula germanica]
MFTKRTGPGLAREHGVHPITVSQRARQGRSFHQTRRSQVFPIVSSTPPPPSPPPSPSPPPPPPSSSSPPPSPPSSNGSGSGGSCNDDGGRVVMVMVVVVGRGSNSKRSLGSPPLPEWLDDKSRVS